MLPDAIVLGFFLAGTFAAAVVTGIAGFAFALVALAVWLHALSPLQAAPLVAAYALLVQGYAVWKLRRSLDVQRLLPFIIGSVIAVPAGIALLQWAPAAALRMGVGTLIILFSAYNLARPRLPELRDPGWAADGAIGVLNGVIGGSTGLAGIAVVIWSAMRGWTRDEQRAVFQPAAIVTFVVILAMLGGGGAMSAQTLALFLVGLPALVAGTWLGWTLYGRLDEAAFRRIILLLLLASGVALVAIRS
jgi:uncharacterized protein